MNIYLASSSPRRQELLHKIYDKFICEASSIDETINFNNDLKKEIENLSYRKANAILVKHPHDLIIGADTIVTIDNQILGKPKTKEKAILMLKKLSGRKHQVITAVTILTAHKVDTFSVVSDVYFNKLSNDDIQKYVDSLEPLDKAGAYGIQGQGGLYINRIDGDYYAIMGLPISELFKHLKTFNIK